ncbi:MAG: hypothetical protein M3071_20350 [Actinomycetota bacterium]|nr:hypothetical protein [Actinomycetota bacterium]
MSLLIVDPGEREVHWLALADREYKPIERSGLIDLVADDLRRRFVWPAAAPDSQ